jgi:6-phosphogluconolactonase/glucosamine-6-phosphate isomerase/deaminase
MKVITFPAVKLARATARLLNGKMAEFRNQSFLLILSGGSSLAPLDYLDTKSINEKTTITVLDDRHSRDPTENNFSLMTATPFYAKAKKNGAKFIDTGIQNNESLEDHGACFERELRSWRNKHPNAPIFATIGIGPDGHVAGMMPYPEDTSLFYKLFEGARWAVGYNAGDKNSLPLRVTVTIPFICDEISFAVSFVSGENKKTALEKVISEKGTLAETPARVLRNMKAAVVCTDIEL